MAPVLSLERKHGRRLRVSLVQHRASCPCLEPPLCDLPGDIRESVICSSDVFSKGLMRWERIGFLNVWPALLLILLIIKMDVPLIAGFPWSVWLSTNQGS